MCTLQAVQDMCMHKMADKLYARLQKVRLLKGKVLSNLIRCVRIFVDDSYYIQSLALLSYAVL